MVNGSLRGYMETLYGPEDELLREMREEAAAQGLPAIQVPIETGRLLQFLIHLSGARRVLEIGTLFGYSSVFMARALPEGGTVVSLEAEAKHAEIARANIRRAGFEGGVEVRLGPAVETLATLADHQFDLVFIDADKPSYGAYLDWALRLTHPGSLIVADNLWRGGEVLNVDEDESARALADYTRRIVDDPRLESVIIPARDCGDAVGVSRVR